MEEIKSSDGSIIAMVVRKSFNKKGNNFLSDGTFPFQLGVNSYKKGYKIKSHFHQKRAFVVNKIQEVLYFKSGGALVFLYDLNRKLVASVNLFAGDLIFFVDGGHGLEISEDTTIIEVKQGPYLGKDTDKELIE